MEEQVRHDVALMDHQSLLHGIRDTQEGLDVKQSGNTEIKRGPSIILGFVFLEGLGVCGISTNLVIYLSSILHETNASIAMNITTWTGTSYFTPFLGALIADSYSGSYKMILFSSLLYLIGMGTITLSASIPYFKPPSCEGNLCPPANNVEKLIFYSGLYLIAFGSGGVKSSLLPLGADQFDEDNLMEVQKKGSFFNYLYFCMNAGALASSTVIVWIEQNIDWGIGYGISTFCILLAFTCFLIGTSTFRLREPGGSPLKNVFQVLVASFQKRKLRVPSENRFLYEVEDNNLNPQRIHRLDHTDEFRCLDKAAIVLNSDMKEVDSWSLCTVTQVEEFKALLRLLPIWVAGIIYSVTYAQMYTTFVEQGKAMETRLGSFSIPPASLYAFEVLSVMLWVLLYDTVIATIARRYLGDGHGLTQLQRMGIGHLLIIVAMATAAILEMKRKESVNKGEPISILWQLPQFFLMACSEVFTYIGQLEFFYDQAPDSMKSMSTALSLLTVSLGNYLSSVIVSLIALVTTSRDSAGWIPDDLNKGHLDYFFWWLAGFSFLNFMGYIYFAKRFTLKRRVFV
ncbi:Proton-dependent oligopeptide transporter family protein [Dioscorea alata]|uniref:Proton-dependent oligopeptide transporter family protein n=1 Tax=Dioscorea alata TaxID=55571 RepID=A0ACB7WHL3_DIOAL|nr:Proton-dependent oligopeptide transporter family protein [Dioscorea alata]